jgi:hypothetical protein
VDFRFFYGPEGLDQFDKNTAVKGKKPQPPFGKIRLDTTY